MQQPVRGAAFIGSGFNNYVGLLAVRHVLQVHHVLGALQDLRPEPAAVAVHAVLFKDLVVII